MAHFELLLCELLLLLMGFGLYIFVCFILRGYLLGLVTDD